MKKSKGEYIIEFSTLFFSYLDRHPMQGRIAVALTFFFLGIKTTSPEIVAIIVAFNTCP